MSDLVVARMGKMLPEKPGWCRNEQICQGRRKVYSALSGPTAWILRYIKKLPLGGGGLLIVLINRLATTNDHTLVKAKLY